VDTSEKLKLLADDSRYDLSCACGTSDPDDHRKRAGDGLWLYPASLPGGGKSIMLKTLLSNVCVNDCLYCPLRSGRDVRRCTLSPDEVAGAYMEYARGRNVFGLFLSSGVIGSPDYTMDRINAVAAILRRKYRYKGYIHLKVIPGASDAAIENAVSLASAVSVNVEAPKRSSFEKLSKNKNFDSDIVRPIKLISSLTAPGEKYARVRQTTQFIVGASDETDADIVKATAGLYGNLRLDRVYFSAYQRGLGAPELPGEQAAQSPQGENLLTREHRLYQVDFLLRAYKWDAGDISFAADGSLPLDADPKQVWADNHPEFFPVRLKSANLQELLRVPGIGPVSARRIMEARRQSFVRDLRDVGIKGERFLKTLPYVVTE
jgi:predicted DNA-binding helix-hairpin-helix protein